MARSRYKIYNNDQLHFLTMTIVEWIPLFMDKEIVSIILNSLKYIQRERGVTLYAYVIMENHLHMVASGVSLNKSIKEFKSFTARCIIDHLKERKLTPMLMRLKRAKLLKRISKMEYCHTERSRSVTIHVNHASTALGMT